MGFVLYREIRDRAPSDWTPAERVVALMIADDANDDTRRSWMPLAGKWRRGEWVDGLTERTGLGADGVSKALQRLAGRGYEFRVPITTGKDGRPVFAVRGHSLDFRVPLIAPRPVPQRPDGDLPFSGLRADQRPGYVDVRPDADPGYDAQRPDRGPRKAGPSSAPSPQHLPSVKPSLLNQSQIQVIPPSVEGSRPKPRPVEKQRDSKPWRNQQAARSPTTSGRPDWCGDEACNPNTRRREDLQTGQDRGPCPDCHPAKARAS